MDEILTVAEVAQYLKVSRFTVWRWCKQGKLPAFKVGREWRIYRSVLDGTFDYQSMYLDKGDTNNNMSTFNQGYGLIIGIANYSLIQPLTPVTLDDALSLSSLLQNQNKCGYPFNQVRCLADKKASLDAIRLGFEWLATSVGQNDTAIIFFSGHGGYVSSGERSGYYLLPVDTDPNNLQQTALKGTELSHLLQAIKAERLVVFLDCCHAGGTGEVKDGLDTDIPGFKAGFDETYYDQLAIGKGRVIVASSRADEKSWIIPGLRNSLFTHYLLKALDGEARTYGNGYIGILDVFNFVSDTVSLHAASAQFSQHPVLKGTMEKNFPIALYKGEQVKDSTVTNQIGVVEEEGTANLIINDPYQLAASINIEGVLQLLFNHHQRLVIKKEFGGGFSGGRVFLIHSVKEDGKEELPSVVKLASISLIEKEWQAYQAHIRNQAPNEIGIQERPVIPPGSQWGGLRYPLAGSGAFAIESFHDYCLQATVEDISFVLNRQLLRSIEKLHGQNRTSAAFSIQGSYDAILPLNLLIEPAIVPASETAKRLTPQTKSTLDLQCGDFVQLEGFAVTKVDLLDDTITLGMPPLHSNHSDASTIRLNAVGDLAAYQINQIIPPIEGKVINTRYALLHQEARRVLGANYSAADETIKLQNLPDDIALPNPIALLPELLKQYPTVKYGTIHGDLNLENILVYPETRSISLIDFAAAREDHLLHDYLRLETEIITKLFSHILAKTNLGPGQICEFYQELHQAVALEQKNMANQLPHPALAKPFTMLEVIRQSARKCLVDFNDWSEYYQGLIIYLLGALKFRNLEEIPEAKSVAFLGAATIAGVRKKLFDEICRKGEPPNGGKGPGGDVREEIEELKEIIADLKESLRLTRRSIRRFGIGFVPLNLQLQETDLQKQIRQAENQLNELRARSA